MHEPKTADLFAFFNEIGIIEQLSRAILEARLPSGLIAPHFTVLNHLTRLGEGRAPIEMARAFQVPKTSMTHTLKGLEERGYIALRANPADGRSKLVYLTDKGRALRAEVIQSLAPDFARIGKKIDLKTLTEVLPVLQDVRITLDADRNGKNTSPAASG
ncbi:MAG: MarR family transcriptional regulator [Pseudomonadota bacterium]